MDTPMTPTMTTLRHVLMYPLIALSLGAGAIHATVTGDHFHESAILGMAFVAVTVFQLGWAVVVIARPAHRVLLAGAAVNTAAIAAWAVSRTVGLPVGSTPWTPEPVGAIDLVCVGLEAAFVVVALIAASGASLRTGIPRSVTGALGAAVALLVTGGTTFAVAAAPAGTTAMSAMAGMGSPGAAMAPGTSLQSVPGHAGMEMNSCTAPVTAAQQAAANQLYEQTKADIAQYSTVAAATAAGYAPATNPAAKIVHYLNAGFVQAGYVLDPNHPAALMFASTASGEQLVGAMFLAPAGQTSGPQPGGCLTQWHIHTNLCLSTATHRDVGQTNADGGCPSGSANHATRAMMHVWTVPVSGGPFAMDLTSSDVASIVSA